MTAKTASSNHKKIIMIVWWAIKNIPPLAVFICELTFVNKQPERALWAGAAAQIIHEIVRRMNRRSVMGNLWGNVGDFLAL